MRLLTLISLLFLFVLPLFAQEEAKEFVTSLLEDMAQDQESALTEDDDLINRLIEILNNPIDLNQASREELEALIFLSDFQIENLLAHQYVNGAIEQVYELSTIKGFAPEDIARLLPFIRIAAPAPSVVYRPSLHGSSLIRVQSSFPRPDGYRSKNDRIGPPYLGKPVKLLHKSEASLGRKWAGGYLIESDAGEPMFGHGIDAVDFLSAFLLFQPRKGIISKVLIGDYSARFGQGLGLWTGFSMGLSSENTSLRKRPSGLTRYHSAGEASFLRGVGVELSRGAHQISLFGSYRPLDASFLMIDTIENPLVSTLRTSGLHRTQSEVDGRNAVDESILGGYYQYSSRLFRAGIGTAAWSVSHSIVPSDELYRLFYFRGSELNSLFIDYRLFLSRLHLYVEVAVQDFGTPAFMQGFDFRPGGGVELTLAYRYFDHGYMAIFQSPYSRSSTPGGEQGLYAAIRFQPLKQATITSTLNYYRFSWMRYRVSAPSSGFDYRLWARYAIDRANGLVLRYRYSSQEQDRLNGSSPSKGLSDHRKQSARVQWINQSSDRYVFQTILEYSHFSERHGLKTSGYWFSQDVKVLIPNWNLSVQARVAHFDTDDYYSRIYVYEPDVLYSFSVPARSGNGVLGLLNVGWDITSNMQCWGRLMFVHRRDADTIGSGYEMVNSDSETEVKLQLRYRF